MHDCAGAHGAGLKGDVQRTARKAVVTERFSRAAQGHDFGMSCGIMPENGLIEAPANDDAIGRDHQGTDGYLATAACLVGKFDGGLHE